VKANPPEHEKQQSNHDFQVRLTRVTGQYTTVCGFCQVKLNILEGNKHVLDEFGYFSLPNIASRKCSLKPSHSTPMLNTVKD
jgi:hypothetical protein